MHLCLLEHLLLSAKKVIPGTNVPADEATAHCFATLAAEAGPHAATELMRTACA